MNAFNRAVVLVLSLATIVASAAVGVAAASPVLRRSLLAAWPALARFPRLFPAEVTARWAVALVALAVLVGGALLIALELRPERREERMLLSSDTVGDVEVVVDSLRRLAEHVAERVPGVREVRSRVVPANGRLSVRCRVAIDPSASVPELARELQLRIGEAVEHHLGKPCEAISVLTQITPITQTRRRVR